MHWDGYTIFSVISGICLIACSVAPGMKVKDRLYSVAGGVIFAVYGFYVAAQTSGTYYFPVWIFIIPFAVVAYVLLHTFAGRQSTQASRQAAAPGRPGAGPASETSDDQQ